MTGMSMTEEPTAVRKVKAVASKWEYNVGDVVRVTQEYAPLKDQEVLAVERLVGQIGKVIYVPGKRGFGEREFKNGFGEYIIIKMMAGWLNAEGRNEWHFQAEELIPLSIDDTVIRE